MSAPFSYEQQGSYTWEQYLALEAQSEERYEYHNGRIVAMSGASNRHNQIAGRAFAALLPVADAKGCKVFYEGIKLFLHQSKQYYYPDLMLTCHPLDLQTRSGVRNPLLVMEVLSQNQPFDLTSKLAAYSQMPSLRHCLMVQQTEFLVLHYHRSSSDELFRFTFYSRLDQEIHLPELSMQMPLSQLYHDIITGPEISIAEEEAALYGTDLPQN
jgi:Uma2 family endonuclease